MFANVSCLRSEVFLERWLFICCFLLFYHFLACPVFAAAVGHYCRVRASVLFQCVGCRKTTHSLFCCKFDDLFIPFCVMVIVFGAQCSTFWAEREIRGIENILLILLGALYAQAGRN